MRVNKYRFFYLLIFVCFKIFFLYFYFIFDKELDYSSLYFSYCEKNSLTEIQNYRIDFLNFFFSRIFVNFCFLSKDIFFLIFGIIQILIATLALKKIMINNYEKNTILLFITSIFFSPTILLYSSAPTKDGFFVLFIFISFLLVGSFKKCLIFIAAFFKPYFIFFLVFLNRVIFQFIFLISILLILFYFSDSFVSLVNKKYDSGTILDIFKYDLSNIVFTFEILIIFFVSFYFKIINRYLILFMFALCLFAALTNINVGSRLFTTGMLYLFLIKDVYKK